ncbi:MAG: CoA transferase [Propionibacteriaceae bacterium]|nr:CoA transferase [Propionibacteriaceae bacterium]
MSTKRGALDGIVVLDLTRVVAGPFASQILGDLGADVIKIERYGKGDEARAYGVDEGEIGPGATFLTHNRNKRSIALDLKQPEGVELLKELVKTADVIINNFRTGVMDRLGLGYEDLSKINPRLIYGWITGFGATGSMATRAANDLSIQSFSGLLSITGEPNGEPVRNPASVCDLTAGMFLTVGILAALHAREETGRGQQVGSSMLHGQMNYLNHFITDYWLVGRVPQMMGTGNRMGIPNQAYPCTDGYVCITSANEAMWKRCAAGLGIPEAGSDPRFDQLKDRYANREALNATVAAATSKMSQQEVVDRMEEAGVPCVPLNTIPQIAEHPVLEETGIYVDMEVEGDRTARLISPAITMSDTPFEARRRPPLLAEHTDEILAAAGFSAERIAELREQNVIM